VHPGGNMLLSGACRARPSPRVAPVARLQVSASRNHSRPGQTCLHSSAFSQVMVLPVWWLVHSTVMSKLALACCSSCEGRAHGQCFGHGWQRHHGCICKAVSVGW
jgi:hypothetical protein